MSGGEQSGGILKGVEASEPGLMTAVQVMSVPASWVGGGEGQARLENSTYALNTFTVIVIWPLYVRRLHSHRE